MTMGAPAWGSRGGGGDRPRLLRMTPLRHSFAAPASPPAPPPRAHDYASDADTNKKGNFLMCHNTIYGDNGVYLSRYLRLFGTLTG